MTKYLSNHFVNYIHFLIGCCLSRSCYAASPLSINQLKHFNIRTSTGNFFGLNMASASHHRKQINEERRIIRTSSRNVQFLNSQVEQVRANAQHESLGDSQLRSSAKFVLRFRLSLQKMIHRIASTLWSPNEKMLFVRTGNGTILIVIAGNGTTMRLKQVFFLIPILTMAIHQLTSTGNPLMILF